MTDNPILLEYLAKIENEKLRKIIAEKKAQEQKIIDEKLIFEKMAHLTPQQSMDNLTKPRYEGHARGMQQLVDAGNKIISYEMASHFGDTDPPTFICYVRYVTPNGLIKHDNLYHRDRPRW